MREQAEGVIDVLNGMAKRVNPSSAADRGMEAAAAAAVARRNEAGNGAGMHPLYYISRWADGYGGACYITRGC